MIALRFLRQRLDVTVDIEEMETEASESQADGEDENYSMKRLLSEPTLRLPLLVTIVLQISQQFSGINAVSGCNTVGKYSFEELFSKQTPSLPLLVTYIVLQISQ